VGATGFEPVTPSVSANHREPLCSTPFSQVGADRRGGRETLSWRPVNALLESLDRILPDGDLGWLSTRVAPIHPSCCYDHGHLDPNLHPSPLVTSGALRTRPLDRRENPHHRVARTSLPHRFTDRIRWPLPLQVARRRWVGLDGLPVASTTAMTLIWTYASSCIRKPYASPGRPPLPWTYGGGQFQSRRASPSERQERDP
jgi:hypothetical protein